MYQSNYGYAPPTTSYGARQTVVPQATPIIQQPLLKGHPVSSLEEARATTIDFDGSVFFFPDLANKKIYTKQINLDGTATINMYELQKLPMSVMSDSVNYITREEFDAALKDLRQSMSVAATQPVQQTPQVQPTPVAQASVPQYKF